MVGAHCVQMFLGTKPILPREQFDAMGRRPRTLVLGWDRMLVHCEWTVSKQHDPD